MADEDLSPEQIREAQNTGVKPVEERHRFDEGRLAEWMAANVEGYEGPLSVNQFKGGQSNPTYELTTPGQKYVPQAAGKAAAVGPRDGPRVQGDLRVVSNRVSRGPVLWAVHRR